MLPPIIDSRDLKSLMKKMKEIYPYYTPEWRFSPEDPDPGTALFMIFAQMFTETIKRFNRVPTKNYMAFLNLLELSLLPSRPASAFLSFKLSTGADKPVLIPAGTQILAESANEAEAIVFETEKNTVLTPASIVDAYMATRQEDIISRIQEEFWADPRNIEKPALKLFDFSQTENIQEHSLFIAHKDLLNIENHALIEVEILNSRKHFKEEYYCRQLADAENIEWAYGSGDEWVTFDEVSSLDNRLLLRKTRMEAIAEREVLGINSRWIKCRIKNTKIEELNHIDIDELSIKAKYLDDEERKGLAPDRTFFNDIEVDINGAYPFGEFFGLYDTFYLASQEAFSKKEADISLEFSLREVENILADAPKPDVNWKMIMRDSDFKEHEPLQAYVLRVSWEYWNGSGWVKLFNNKEYEEIFANPTETEKHIRFQCPKDMEETFVNDQLNYWIRLRVLSIHNIFAANVVYRSPWIENISLKYEYPGISLPLQQCISYNNLEYLNHRADLIKNRPFKPFAAVDTEDPAFYLGFDQAPIKGPIAIFFSIRRQKQLKDELPFMEWEYLKKSRDRLEWAKLTTIDESNSLTESGLLHFIGPQDFARAKLFGKNLFWIRLLSPNGRLENKQDNNPLPIINGIYLNASRAVQQKSILREMLESANSEVFKKYQLKNSPVISVELWVDEEGHLSTEEKRLLYENELSEVREVKDEFGNSQKFWVRWERVDDFLESDSESRHYTIDYSVGEIAFGDGKNGKIPPSSGVDNIEVNYKTGGGLKGNIEAFEICRLQNSIAFVDEVFNPEPSAGGCNMETLQEGLKRGPQIIKHHNRAVSAGDFEWLARQATQNIARVKCLPNTNLQGERETGCITLVVLPKGGNKGRRVFPEVKQEVQKYILERTAGNLLFPGKINIIEPVYLEISIYAIIGIKDMEAMAIIEQEAIKKLDDFLDTPEDDLSKKGWEIGQYPHISVFYTLLKSISSVNYVENVSMTVIKIEDGNRTEIDPERILEIAHGIVVNGKHRIILKTDY